MRIENWSVVCRDDNPYAAPEQRRMALAGKAYGHPRYPDGHEVITSTIVSVQHRTVYTESGSDYLLGKPSEDFIEWCRENGHHDPSDIINPIKGF